MGTRPGLRSIPHISGILLLMQLLLLQPLVDAKAETSAAVHARFEASPAKVTKVTGFSLRTAVSNRHIKYMFVEKNMDRDTAKAACTLLNGTLATPSTYDEFDFLDSHMEQGGYHLGAQCKDCTGAEEDKWEWSTGEPLSLRFGKWGSSSLRHGSGSWLSDRGKYPYGNEDDINLFAYKPSCAAKLCQAYLINFNVKTSGHAICQENIA